MPRFQWVWLKDATLDVGVAFFVLGLGTQLFSTSLDSGSLSASVVLLVIGFVLVAVSVVIAVMLGDG